MTCKVKWSICTTKTCFESLKNLMNTFTFEAVESKLIKALSNEIKDNKETAL